MNSVERILDIRRWTPTVMSFRTSRPEGFRFTPGHYARLGLERDGDVVWRPYSIASAAGAPHLEFLLVLIPGGAFSERMRSVRPGDPVLVQRASFGFLTLSQLAPGESLWLLATGTGIGPFVSILQEPSVWEAWRRVIVVHGARTRAELAYRDELAQLARAAAGAGAAADFVYLPSVTREPGGESLQRRIPELIADGTLEHRAQAPLRADTARVLACGNPAMLRAVRAQLSERGFATSRRGIPGQMAFENYWQEP